MVLLPGAGVIYTVSTGLFEGWRASIAAAFGCTAGIVPHLLVSSLGLSTLLHTSALAFQVIRQVGRCIFVVFGMDHVEGNRITAIFCRAS